MKTLTCECGWTFEVDSTNLAYWQNTLSEQLENAVVRHLMSCHVVFEEDFVRDTVRILVKEKSAVSVCPVCGHERKVFDMREWTREDGKVAKICTGCSDTICAAFADREEDRQ